MSADIILFIPRANPKADRAFWKGPDRDAILAADRNAVEIVGAAMIAAAMAADDTAPSDYVAPSDDCA